MTLALAFGNTQYAVVVADHRLMVDGRLHDVEAVKAGLLVSADARAVFAFSGLAQAGAFRTDLWFLSAFAEAGPPEFTMGAILDRVRHRASHDIARLRVRRLDRRLSVIAAGYSYAEVPPRLHLTLLSNFERDNEFLAQPMDAFDIHHTSEKRPATGEPAAIRIAGATALVARGDLEAITELLEQRASAAALVGKAVQTIRRAAARPEARTAISDRCLSVVLPRDPNDAPIVQNHLADQTTHVYGLPQAIARPELAIAVGESKITAHEAEGGWVPRVGRNKPCLCGSGKKYKYCHGA